MAKAKKPQSSKVDKEALDRITKRVFKYRPSKQKEKQEQNDRQGRKCNIE